MGTEAGNVGPESFYPISNVVSNNEHRELLLLSSFLLSTAPTVGRIKSGAQNTPDTKALFP